MDPFRVALDASLAEFKKKILIEVEHLVETLSILENKALQTQQLDPAMPDPPMRSSDTSQFTEPGKGEEEDKGLSKQRPKKKFKTMKKVPEKPIQEADRLLDHARNDGFIRDQCDEVNEDTEPRPTVATEKSPVAATFFTDPIVVASCPELFHDEVMTICRNNNFAKAFGMKGDMVDLLSGDDWVGKWEAKVVMSVVTKARAMNSNNVRIVCIQGGKHCDKEVAAQPRLKKAILQEFGENLRVGMEWLEMEEFRERYVLKGVTDDTMKIFFCHKQSNSVDAVLNLKLQLEQRLPRSIFYNAGFEEEAGREKVEIEVKNCTHFIIFLTKGALLKQHVLAQISCAVQNRKTILLVMETDKACGGVNLADETETLEDDGIKGVFKTNMMVPWSREESLQEVGLDKIVSSISVGIDGKRLVRVRTSQSHAPLEMFHPYFQTFCNVSGIVMPGAWRQTEIVAYVTLALAILTLVNTIIVACLPKTNDVRDFRDLFAHPLILIVISWSSLVVKKTFSCEEVLSLVDSQRADVHLNRRIVATSKQMTFLGIVGVFFFLAYVLIQFVQFVENFNDGASSSSHQTMRLIHGITLLVAYALCILQGTCMSVVAHCVFFMTVMAFASAFNHLHPQIQDFGIQKSVEQGMIIHVTDLDFVRFQRSYIDVWRKVRVGLSWSSCIFLVVDVTYIMNLAFHLKMVLSLLRSGKPEDSIEGFTSEGWHLSVRPFAIFCADVVFLGRFIYMHLFKRSISQWVARLIFTKSSSRVAVGNFVNELAIDFPVLPVTERLRYDTSMTKYAVLIVLMRWALFTIEFYIVDY